MSHLDFAIWISLSLLSAFIITLYASAFANALVMIPFRFLSAVLVLADHYHLHIAVNSAPPCSSPLTLSISFYLYSVVGILVRLLSRTALLYMKAAGMGIITRTILPPHTILLAILFFVLLSQLCISHLTLYFKYV